MRRRSLRLAARTTTVVAKTTRAAKAMKAESGAGAKKDVVKCPICLGTDTDGEGEWDTGSCFRCTMPVHRACRIMSVCAAHEYGMQSSMCECFHCPIHVNCPTCGTTFFMKRWLSKEPPSEILPTAMMV